MSDRNTRPTENSLEASLRSPSEGREHFNHVYLARRRRARIVTGVTGLVLFALYFAYTLVCTTV